MQNWRIAKGKSIRKQTSRLELTELRNMVERYIKERMENGHSANLLRRALPTNLTDDREIFDTLANPDLDTLSINGCLPVLHNDIPDTKVLAGNVQGEDLALSRREFL